MASISGNAYRILRGITFVSPWLLQLAVADLCLCALLPVSIVRPTLSYDISSSIAASVWNAVQLIFTSLNGAKVTTSGATLPLNESAIIVSNHLAWTDFYMIQSLAIEAGMLGRCRWFAKKQLQWVPLLGVGLRVMGMPLVSRNWLQDRTELRRTFDNIVDHQWPICMILVSKLFLLLTYRSMQGSYHIANLLAFRTKSTRKLFNGVESTERRCLNILCILALEGLWPLYKSSVEPHT